MIKTFKKYILSPNNNPWDFFNTLVTQLNANARESDDRLKALETPGLSGEAVLVAGQVVVNLPQVTNRSRIFLTSQNSSGTTGFLYVLSRVEGVSFTIASESAADTSTVAWYLIEPKD